MHEQSTANPPQPPLPWWRVLRITAREHAGLAIVFVVLSSWPLAALENLGWYEGSPDSEPMGWGEFAFFLFVWFAVTVRLGFRIYEIRSKPSVDEGTATIRRVERLRAALGEFTVLMAEIDVRTASLQRAQAEAEQTEGIFAPKKAEAESPTQRLMQNS